MVLGALLLLSLTFYTINIVKNRTAQVEYKSSTSKITEEAANTTMTNKTHEVIKGENLWVIAEKYYNSGYNWVDIYTANKLNNANIILEGQILNIPNVNAKQITVDQTSTTTIVTNKNTTSNNDEKLKLTSSVQGDSYIVLKGDNLWQIAVRAYGDGYKWVDLAKNNNIKNPNIIYVGANLKLQR